MIQQTMDDGFTRHVRFVPSYDYRDDREDQRGAGGMMLHFALVGSKGAMTCGVDSGWMLRPLKGTGWTIEAERKPIRRDKPGVDEPVWDLSPSGTFLGSHIDDPNGQPCDFLPSGKCQLGGSFTASDAIIDALVGEGDDGIWRVLREFYDRWVLDSE